MTPFPQRATGFEWKEISRYGYGQLSFIMLRIATILTVVLLGNPSPAAEPSPMQEIHLIHHSHTDLGFTDLASTAMRLHAGYIAPGGGFRRRHGRLSGRVAFPLDVRKRADGRTLPPRGDARAKSPL